MVLRAARELGFDIHVPYPFEFPAVEVPLSWVLTNKEQVEIGRGWGDVRKKRECTVQQLRTFITGGAVSKCPNDVQ